MADPQTDAAIAKRWPEAWAKANNPALRGRSKARQKIRQRFAFAIKMDEFRAANPDAKCINCEHYEIVPHSLGGERHCSIQSDFYGYAMTKPDNVCLSYSSPPGGEG